MDMRKLLVYSSSIDVPVNAVRYYNRLPKSYLYSIEWSLIPVQVVVVSMLPSGFSGRSASACRIRAGMPASII